MSEDNTELTITCDWDTLTESLDVSNVGTGPIMIKIELSKKDIYISKYFKFLII
jgi:hypothetical protein